MIDGGIEAARLSGNAQALSLALMNRSLTAHSAGEIELAMACGEEALELAKALDNGSREPSRASRWRARCGRGRAGARAELLVAGGGGEDLPRMPSAWRAGGFELLALACLAARRRATRRAAADALRRARRADRAGPAAAQAARAAAAVALETGEPDRAAGRALAAATRFDASRRRSTPRSRASRRPRAGGGGIAAARSPSSSAPPRFEACGAPRRRDEAERELRRLGRTSTPQRAQRPRALTARELEIARLVVAARPTADRRGALPVQEDVETHLRNIFGKLGVSSRVELARAVERSDRAT